MENGKKIIRVWHKGLGDALQHSTLPMKFAKLGYGVWISHESPTPRNVYDLVYGLNPHVKGISTEPANCGEIPGFEYDNPCDDFIKNWQSVNGLEPTDSYPIIYYQPKTIPSLKDVTLIDISCNSRKADYNFHQLSHYLEKHIGNPSSYSIRFTQYDKGQNPYCLQEVRCDSLFHYCDMIHSCKKFICLNSGGNSLASALKRNKDIDVDCLVTKTPTFESMYARKNFFYPNINYVWL